MFGFTPYIDKSERFSIFYIQFAMEHTLSEERHTEGKHTSEFHGRSSASFGVIINPIYGCAQRIGAAKSHCQCCVSESGSTGSTCFWTSRIRILLSSCKNKNSKKNLDSYYFATLFDFSSLKNDVNVPSKSIKQKKLC